MVSGEEFVTIHNQSDSTEEVARKTGMKISAVYQRTANYRKKGVPLKYFGIGRGKYVTDWSSIIAAAQAALDGSNGTPPEEKGKGK